MWWREVEVAAPAGDIWALLTDTTRWPDWGPTVRAVRLDHPGHEIGAGSIGAVQTPVGVWLPFEITAYDEVARTWSWHVVGVPATSHRVEVTAPRTCRVGIGVPWWAPPYVAVVEVGLRRLRELAETR